MGETSSAAPALTCFSAGKSGGAKRDWTVGRRLAGVVTIVVAICRCPSIAAPPERAESAWIDWDTASDRWVSHTDKGAAYPRAKQLSNGEILLGYHHGGSLGEYGTWVTLRKSRDGGATWHSTQVVEGPEGETFWGFSNVDFVELHNGRMLLATAGRGKARPGEPEFLSECERSALRIRFSEDYGTTWGPPVSIIRGRGRVWEPSIVKMPGQQIEIYYANEAPDLLRDGRLDQRIEMTRSDDQGVTWTAPVCVAQRNGCRNGMPSAALLQNGRVACAQEVVRNPGSPWITQTFRGQPVAEYLAQTRYEFGAAPFLLAHEGKTLLAFHSGFRKPAAPEGAPLPWMFTNVWVLQGDAEAKRFGPGTQPWPSVDARAGLFFPSLMIKNDGTVVVLASFLQHGDNDSSRTTIRWIEGRLRNRRAE